MEESKNVALILGGAFCPPHLEHVEILKLAAIELQNQGLNVLGCWMAASTDGYVGGKLGVRNNKILGDEVCCISAKHRAIMVDLIADNDSDSNENIRIRHVHGRSAGSANQLFKILKRQLKIIPNDCRLCIVQGADRAKSPKSYVVRSNKDGFLRVLVGRGREESNRILNEWPGLDNTEIDNYWKNPKVLNFADRIFFIPASSSREISSSKIRSPLIQLIKSERTENDIEKCRSLLLGNEKNQKNNINNNENDDNDNNNNALNDENIQSNNSKDIENENANENRFENDGTNENEPLIHSFIFDYFVTHMNDNDFFCHN